MSETILFINNNITVQNLLAEWIAEIDTTLNHVQFPNFELAFDFLQESEPILIIIDGETVKKHPCVFLTRTMSIGKDLSAPILIIVQQDNEKMKRECYELGATDCITTPLLKEEVLARIKNTLNLNPSYQSKSKSSSMPDLDYLFSPYTNFLPGMAYRCLNESGWPMRYVSQGSLQLTGYTSEEICSTLDFYDNLIHPDDRSHVWETIQSAIKEMKAFELDYRITHKDGKQRWVWEQGRNIQCPVGESSIIEGFISDITPRKEMEQTLKNREEQFRALFDNMTSGVAIYKAINDGEDFVFVDINNQGQILSHQRKDQIIGKRVTEIFPSIQQFGLFEVFQEVYKYGLPIRHPLSLYKDGRLEEWVENQVFKLPSGLIVAIYDDSSEIHRAEEEIRFQALLLEQIQDMITATDLQGKITYVNDATCRSFNRPKDQLIGQHVSIFGEDSSEGATQQEIIDFTLRDGKWRGEIVNFLPGNLKLYADFKSQVINDHLGKPIGMVGFSTDITEQKRKEKERVMLENQFRQSQKMEAIGQLTGGVAHDFNNLLQVINGVSQLILSGISNDHPHYRYLVEISKAGDRAAMLVKQLLSFSRRQIMRPKAINLNVLVEDLLIMVRRIIGEHIQLEWVPGISLPSIQADQGMIEQALINLCVNARDAMPDGGLLTIKSFKKNVTETFNTAYSEIQKGQYVVLTITDTGLGMEQIVLDHLFEPFYTTKKDGKGSGLGLATVYGIMKQHNGMIDVSSSSSSGTQFEIYFPPCDMVPQQDPQAEVPSSTGGKETILLAEDDKGVRCLAEEILKLSGYSMIVAKNGLEAIKLFEKHQNEIDLVLLDVIMPVMGGHEAYLKMQKMNQNLNVLFTSGYSETAIHTNFVLDKDLVLLQKPYSTESLKRTVRELLDKKNKTG
jgi:PAS domain S-box-containing protein